MKRAFIYLNVIVTAVFLLFRFYRYDMAIIADSMSLGLEIILGLSDYLVCVLYGLWSVVCVIYAVVKFKTVKWKAVIPTVVCVFILFFTFVFPMTALYQKLNYYVNMNDRIKTIEMVKNGDMANYILDTHRYKAPYRHTSYTGTILVQEKDGVIKVMFYTYRGFKTSKVLVYVSDDSDIEKSADNWYFDTVTQ